jgi:hypothetical protein
MRAPAFDALAESKQREQEVGFCATLFFMRKHLLLLRLVRRAKTIPPS